MLSEQRRLDGSAAKIALALLCVTLIEMDAEALRALQQTHIVLYQSTPGRKDTIAAALRRDGYQVVEADSQEHLLQLLDTAFDEHGSDHPIDLVIADAFTPSESGLAALAWLRQYDWATPFILTAAGGPEDGIIWEARRLGVTAVLHKSFELHELRTLVSMFASRPYA